MKQGTAIIIGAGPAGLTAAIELERRSGIKGVSLKGAGQHCRTASLDAE
jgi:thioredoxin reductase